MDAPGYEEEESRREEAERPRRNTLLGRGLLGMVTRDCLPRAICLQGGTPHESDTMPQRDPYVQVATEYFVSKVYDWKPSLWRVLGTVRTSVRGCHALGIESKTENNMHPASDLRDTSFGLLLYSDCRVCWRRQTCKVSHRTASTRAISALLT